MTGERATVFGEPLFELANHRDCPRKKAVAPPSKGAAEKKGLITHSISKKEGNTIQTNRENAAAPLYALFHHTKTAAYLVGVMLLGLLLVASFYWQALKYEAKGK